MPLESLDEVFILLFKAGPVGEVTGSQADSESLARVGRANSTSRRANSRIVASRLECFLTCAVGLDLNLRDKVTPGGHLQATAVLNAIGVQLSQLLKHAVDVDDCAIAEDVLALRVEDSTWQQVEGVLDTIGDDSVASIGSTVEARTHIVVLRENVDKLALALVAPLRAKDDAEARVEAGGAPLTSLQ